MYHFSKVKFHLQITYDGPSHMYKLLLISKYLRRRRIAWLSLLAVCLCTAMVLVVLSVMGGWLRMFRESFRGLSGSVIVESPSLKGFPHYNEICRRVRELPEVNAAVPSIRTFAFINLLGRKSDGVQIVGIDIDQIGKINKFPQSLYRQYEQPNDLAKDPKATPEERAQATTRAAAASTRPNFDFPLTPEEYRDVWHFQNPKTKKDGYTDFHPMIVGNGVINIYRNEKSEWVNRNDDNYRIWATVTMAGFDARGNIDAESRVLDNFWVTDVSHTGVYQVDANTVYVPFDLLQKDLGMNATDEGPAKASAIDIDVKPGFNLVDVRKKISQIVDAVLLERGMSIDMSYPKVLTWEEDKADYLSQIENEVSLTTTLFSFISIVAIFMIFCIFYMIVQEKTRDIGIIKAVGATNGGVAAIFIGYGCAIGMVGGGLGFAIGWAIVHNINALHQLVAHLTGRQIWNPRVYLFDFVPNTVDPEAAVIIVAVAILSSIIGAVIPAIRAARLNPVEALRFE